MSDEQSAGDTKYDLWEVGVHISDDHDQWKHYHPVAETEEEAAEKALEEANGIGTNTLGGRTDALQVYMVSGPYEREEHTEEDR